MKNAYEKFNPATRTWEADNEKASKDFANAAYVKNGVVRWHNNDAVPQNDILAQWKAIGLDFDYEKSVAERDREVSEACRQYRESRAKFGYSAEELFEMRNAFGANAEVVDVVTGKKIRF